MTWTLICTFIAFMIFLMYNITSLIKFNTPSSLSMTFYYWKEETKWKRLLFPIMMISMAGLLLPAWLTLSASSPFQFTAFLAAAGIMFTGSAPAFKSSDLENSVHMTSAIVAAIFALLWIILVTKLWWIIVIWFIASMLMALLTNSIKSSYIYWLEFVAFMSTFTAILMFCLI
jgi:hypothetical protein